MVIHLTWCLVVHSFKFVTSVKIKKDVYRDDTVPRILSEALQDIGVRVCTNLPQPPKTRCREGVAEDGRIIYTYVQCIYSNSL